LGKIKEQYSSSLEVERKRKAEQTTDTCKQRPPITAHKRFIMLKLLIISITLRMKK
jgi:hypothetical protein